MLLTITIISAALTPQLTAQQGSPDEIAEIAAAVNAAQQSPNGIPPFMSARPLVSNYDSRVRVTSFFDHDLPAYETEMLAGIPADLRDSTRTKLVTFIGDQLTVNNNAVIQGSNSYSGHDGIDFTALEGTEVLAPADGLFLVGSEATVLLTNQNGTPILDENQKKTYTANTCLVWLGHDLSEPRDNRSDASTVYMHLSQIGTASADQRNRPNRDPNITTWVAGDHIDKGELIGRAGNNPCGGGSNGAHLHFGVAAGESNRTSPRIYDPFGWWKHEADPWADTRLNNVSGLWRKPSASSWAWEAALLPTANQPGYQGPEVLAMTDDTDVGFQLFGPASRQLQITPLRPDPNQGRAPIGTGAWISTSISDETTTQKNWAVWGLQVPATGQYRIQAHLPQLPAGVTATTTARYTVAFPDSQGHITRWISAPFDQHGTNTWSDIVAPSSGPLVTLQASTVVLVALSDVTGTANQQVIFDAIRLRAESAITPPGDPVRTIPIGLAVDNSSSMIESGKINAVKDALPPWIDQLTALQIRLAFRMEAFANNNPPVQQTDDPVVIKTLIQALSGNDNGLVNNECPEESLGAIRLLAPTVAGGHMLFFSDDVPFSPEQGKNPTLQVLADNSVKFHAIILPKTCNFGSGNDPSGFNAYRYLAETTGGTYQVVSTNQTADALAIVLNEIRANSQLPTTADTTSMVAPSATGGTTSRLIVDSTVTQLNVLLNILSGTPTLQLIRPDGTTVSAGPGVTVTTTNGAIYYRITAPTTGEWQAVVGGTGEYRLSSSIEGPIQFAYLSDLVGSVGVPMEIVAQLSGPIASANFAVAMTNGQSIPLALADNGQHNDAVAGDGVYSGWLIAPVAGTGVLRVDGQTTTGTAFARIDTRLIRVQPLAIEAPPTSMLAAGDSQTLTFTLSNLGATVRSFALSVTSPGGWILTGPPATIQMQPAEKRTINIVVKAPRSAAGTGLEPISLTAIALDDPTTSVVGWTALSIVTGSGPVPQTYRGVLPSVIQR